MDVLDALREWFRPAAKRANRVDEIVRVGRDVVHLKSGWVVATPPRMKLKRGQKVVVIQTEGQPLLSLEGVA